MKLATRYQRSHLIATLVMFLLAGTAFYLLLHRVLLFQMDEDLEIEQREIETYVARFRTLPQNVVPVEDQLVSYRKVAAPMQQAEYRTTLAADGAGQGRQLFRRLLFTVKAGDAWYQVAVGKSLEATNGLTRAIGLIAVSVIALLLLALFLINRLLLRRLWAPFYQTIGRLKRFDLESNRSLKLPPVGTEEFQLLNSTLTAVSEKAAKDYALLKEFTENAAHELQTPLAIVRSRLDLLIQDEAMSERQSRTIQDAYTAVSRMTRLNQSLLELARIEGGLYGARSVVDMAALLTEKLTLLEELLQDKDISVESQLGACRVLMNPVLADMLLNNLLTNAIYHNIAGGRIVLSLDANRLSVCNTSYRGALKQSGLFARFAKFGEATSGTGLGLSISRQICAVAHCHLAYHYNQEHLHCFTVEWNGARPL